MTLQLTQSQLAQVRSLAAAGNFPQAYALTAQFVTANTPNPTADDQNVLHWLDVAQQVNSGATTSAAIAIRAQNAAAVAFENGQSIGLFDPLQQTASNEVAKAFFNSIDPLTGNLQNFNQIAQAP